MTTSHTQSDYIASRIAAVCATFSVISGFILIILVLYYRKFKSTSGRLLLLLFCSDLTQSISTSLSYRWWYTGPYHSTFCDVQGWMQSIGDMASILASASVAVHLLMAIFQWSGAKIEIAAIVVTVSVPIIFAVTGYTLAHATEQQDPYWAPSGGWCWISGKPSHALKRWVFFYIWVLIVLVALCILYGIIMFRLSQKNSMQINARINTKRQRTMQKMLGFPVVFLIVYGPIASLRIVSWALGEDSVKIPVGLLYTSNALYALSGLFNAITYGYTRHRAFTEKNALRRPLLQQHNRNNFTATIGSSSELSQKYGEQ